MMVGGAQYGLIPFLLAATWGHTREEALAALQEAAELLVEHLIACGEEVPVEDVETIRVFA